MTKFKNIKRNPTNDVEMAAAIPTPVVAAPKKKTEKRAIKAEPAAVKSPAKAPPSKDVRAIKTTPSRLGKSVLVLSFIVVIQIILLVSIIYLSPTLVR